MFFLFRSSLQNSRNILFSFLSNLSHLYFSFHASRYLRVFLAEAGVSNAVLISLSSDDCFPPKKLSSSTAFHYKEASFTLWISRCCLVWIFSGKTQFHLNVWFKGSNIWSWRCTVNMLRLLLCKKNKIHLHSFLVYCHN